MILKFLDVTKATSFDVGRTSFDIYFMLEFRTLKSFENVTNFKMFECGANSSY